MTQEGFKLGLDSRSGFVVHIDQVKDGFEYGVCPECKSELIASNRHKSTRKNATYFRHKIGSDCQGETLIHLWAKQIIAEKKSALGAEYTAVANAKDLAKKYHQVQLTQSCETLVFSNVELEVRISQGTKIRTPDVMCNVVDGSILAVEIFVSSAVTEPKREFFADMGLDCLEIDLSKMPLHFLNSPQDFEQYVINGAPRSWIQCSKYPALEQQAQIKANEKAKLASELIKGSRNRKRNIKAQWIEKNSNFVRLVDAYLKLSNQKKAQLAYKNRLEKVGHKDNVYKNFFETNFGVIPDIINIPVTGELGFNCHRSIWQWEVYSRVVLASYFKSLEPLNKPIKSTRATRGYDDAARILAWYDHAKKWSPVEIYKTINQIVPLNRVCIESEKIAGMPLMTERDKPTTFVGLKVKDWRAIPKPVCTIRRYLKELVNLDVLDIFEGDRYYVPYEVELPLVFDVSYLNDKNTYEPDKVN